eukprot:PLAT1150.1.p2 GENE.PLAT1150.1~~PLAT1150.1.p2  ORF type:complete len:828 (-),score=437.37 PLAT1150.1:66-2549(-)
MSGRVIAVDDGGAASGGVSDDSGLHSQESRMTGFGRPEGMGNGRWKQVVHNAIKKRRETFEYVEEGGAVSLRTKLAWGAPMFSITSLTMLIGIHGTVFYTSIMGANVSFIAFFTALARSFDVLTDPLMGWFSDRTRTKWGRRRPFMAVGCFGYALFFYLLFSPPEASPTSTSLWFGFFYVFFYAFDTMCNVPYGALGPELTDNADERNNVFFWANMFKGIGILCGAVGPVVTTLAFAAGNEVCTSCEGMTCDIPVNSSHVAHAWFNATTCTLSNGDLTTLENNLAPGMSAYCGCTNSLLSCERTCTVESNRMGFRTVSLIFGLYFIASMLFCVFSIKEREASCKKEQPPLIPSLLATLRNKPFVGLLPAWVLDMTAYTMIGTMLPFYLRYVIVPSSVPQCLQHGRRAPFGLDPDMGVADNASAGWCEVDNWLALGLVALMSSTIFSMPLWLAATKKFGKRNTWLAYNLLTAVTNGLFVFVGRGDPKTAMVLAFLNGIPGGAQFLTESIVADVIDYDEFLTGVRSEGRFTIFQTFIPKIVSIPAQALPLAMLSYFGFDPMLPEQKDSVKFFISLVFFVLPFFMAIGSFIIKLRFPIKSEATAKLITRGAALHMQGRPAKDPLTGRWLSLFQYKAEGEEQLSWKMDNFFPHQLQTLLDEGPAVVAANLKKTLLQQGVIVSIAFLLTVIGVSLGWLNNARVSWIPSFSIIIVGMGATALGFNFLRRKAALGMVDQALPREFIQRWLTHLRGAATHKCDPEGDTTKLLDAGEETVDAHDASARAADAFAAGVEMRHMDSAPAEAEAKAAAEDADDGKASESSTPRRTDGEE